MNQAPGNKCKLPYPETKKSVKKVVLYHVLSSQNKKQEYKHPKCVFLLLKNLNFSLASELLFTACRFHDASYAIALLTRVNKIQIILIKQNKR
jgi:hypothetical protein